LGFTRRKLRLAPLVALSMYISWPELVMPKWEAVLRTARNSLPTEPGGKDAEGQSRRTVRARPVLL